MSIKFFSTEKSRRVNFVEWDSKTQDLKVEFKRGGTYIYHKVPEAIYDLLAAALSVGRTLNANVIGRYEFTRKS